MRWCALYDWIIVTSALSASPDAHVSVLPSGGCVRAADDLVLASLVDDAIPELEVHGQDPARRWCCVGGLLLGFGLAIGAPQRIARRALDRVPRVRSQPVPVALVGECSIPVVQNVARQPRSSY
jgi:hypothetical protein